MTSRENPSARFRELQRIYGDVHATGLSGAGADEGAELFAGNSLLPFVEQIRELVHKTGARTLLDYGSGKGAIHRKHELTLAGGKIIGPVRDYWGVSGVTLYDPGVPEYAELPSGRFEGVISTDVLEHIPEEDIPWVLREMFGYADRFVFANIASYPARKTLPNGWNAHICLKPPEWWRAQIEAAAQGWPGSDYLFVVSQKREGVDRLIGKLTGAGKMKATEIRKAV
jgi:hypothetical protein